MNNCSNIQINKIYLPYHEGYLSKLKNLLFAKKLRDCTIFHITGDTNYISLSLPGKKTILTIHDVKSLFSNKHNFLKKWLIKLFWLTLPLKKSNQITTISEFSKLELLKFNPNINKKLTVIPNCIDDNWFVKELHPKPFNNTVLAIGTKPNKNIERIIKAANITKSKLIIIGKLNQKQHFIAENINITLYQNLSRNEIRKIYLQSDILLFPSLYEGFGLPIIEAQALGVPVITSDLEPMRTVSGDGAILVNPLSIKEISEAIIKIKNNAALRTKLIHEGYKNAMKYKCSEIAKYYYKLYEKMLPFHD
jgi:glycosyltransferase involved in cell wall biosynthesis